MTLLDLRGVACPMNLVRAKLALEALAPGELLEVTLDPGEGLENVPRALREGGHAVEVLAGAPARLRVRKAGGEPRP